MRHVRTIFQWRNGGATRLALAALALAAVRVHAQVQESVVGTLHDLSVSGPGAIHALDEEQVCIFCHTPHNATGQRPLWNRHMPLTHYRVYASSTTDARIDQPSGESKMCLSCHDGALAIGLLASRPPNDPVLMSQRTIPPGPSDLTNDLSDDHPIGFRFDRALANRDRQLKNPDLVSRELPMGVHGEVHCTTCHDPHNNKLGDFLRITDVRSAICLSCHDLNGWKLSSHANSPKTISGRAVDPAEPLPYHTVAENGCTNCHKIHSARGRERLLRFAREEDNCLNCHNGSVAQTNIASEIRKPSAHQVERYTGRHDPTENFRTMQRHVECADCHNPHATAPNLVGNLNQPSLGLIETTTRFVSGVDRLGREVENARFGFEICFKCHADSINRPRQGTIPRDVTQTNTRMEFQTGNPSYHPVLGPRNNNDVVSLRSPWRVGSTMQCTDCHNSDQADTGIAGSGRGRVLGLAGPHGSIYSPLLIANYDTSDYTTESPEAFSLCYRCHDRQSILNDESFPLHNIHITRGRASCAACHDPHGISRAQGNSSNHSNLINFDLSVVRAATGGLGARVEFEDLGRYRGSCTLTCHSVTHVRFQYGN